MSSRRLAAPRPLRFLVVEDDEDHADLILGVLRERSDGGATHTADHVADGQAALDHLERLRDRPRREWPDVVLLDLKLPKVDGLDVLDRMKGDPTLRTIPVVVLTTSDAEVDRARAYHAHANSYLVKPLSYEKFEALVEELGTYWGEWNRGPGPR